MGRAGSGRRRYRERCWQGTQLDSALLQLREFETAVSKTCAPVRISPSHSMSRFRYSIEATSVEEIVVARVSSSSAVTVNRSDELINSSDTDYVKISWQRAGTSWIRQGKRACRALPGSIVAYRTGTPYEIECDAGGGYWSAVIVAIPVDRLGRDSGTICAQALIARPSLTGLTRSLSLFADDLTRCASSPRLALQVRPRTLQMRWQASLLVHSLSPRRFRVSPKSGLSHVYVHIAWRISMIRTSAWDR
ncbi:hypothetical protein [Rhodococcus oxybenzonivorans]